MKLILVRHGDPDYDLDCLTEKGHRQAKMVANRLMTEGIDEIYVSPQGRAMQTAQDFADLSGIGPMHVLDFMREIRFGKEDALYKSGNPWLCSFDLVRQGKDLLGPDWRNYPEFEGNTATIDADKVMAGADEWLKTMGYQREGLYYRCTSEKENDKTVVLFSHGGSSTALLSRVFNVSFPYLCVVFGNLPHTAITILEFDPTPGALTMPIMELGVDAGHLKEM